MSSQFDFIVLAACGIWIFGLTFQILKEFQSDQKRYYDRLNSKSLNEKSEATTSSQYL